MQIQLFPETDRLLTEEAYAVYRQCMYKPTYEIYLKKMNEFIGTSDIFIYSGNIDGQMAGIIVLERQDINNAEIVGIAVSADYQRRGIGRALIEGAAKSLNLKCVYAETDDDAAGFYRAAGFVLDKEIKHYPDGDCIRYNCKLTL
ncbi:MAG: GNAT family N-acetyltransferase [Oscillospiraceae bacterium]|nr:GNAT family N-acetyltransferase [Oscillospiraceae bacterium]